MENINYEMSVSNLGNLSPLRKSVTLIQKPQLLIVLAFGIVLLFSRNTGLMILGGIFSAIPLFILFFIKDRKIIDIHENEVVVYDIRDSEQCYCIPFTDIDSYSMETYESRSIFVIHTVSGYQVQVHSGSSKIIKEFKAIMPDNEKFTKWKTEFDKRNSDRKKTIRK